MLLPTNNQYENNKYCYHLVSNITILKRVNMDEEVRGVWVGSAWGCHASGQLIGSKLCFNLNIINTTHMT